MTIAPVVAATAPFGIITLDQNGTTLDVTVHLFNGNLFVKTGAADFLWFKFNATGVVTGDITVNQNAPKPLSAVFGTFNGDGTGDFFFGIACATCANGAGADAFGGDVIFHEANATIGDLTVPNNLGNVFVADIFSPQTGNTGPVDATTLIPSPEPGTLTLLGMSVLGLGAALRRRMKS